jgi:hypothetical protein
LYKTLGSEFYDYLENDDVKAKISYRHKWKRPLRYLTFRVLLRIDTVIVLHR